MVAPPRLTSIQPGQVCKLKERFYIALSKPKESGFLSYHPFLFLRDTQFMNDHSLFINSSEGSFTTLLVYMYDIILAGNDKE